MDAIRVDIPNTYHVVKVTDARLRMLRQAPGLALTLEFLDLIGVKTDYVASPLGVNWKNVLFGFGIPTHCETAEQALFCALGDSALLGRTFEINTTMRGERLHLRSIRSCEAELV